MLLRNGKITKSEKCRRALARLERSGRRFTLYEFVDRIGVTLSVAARYVRASGAVDVGPDPSHDNGGRRRRRLYQFLRAGRDG